MAPKEKEELRLPLPETAIKLLMAACAPAAELDFQSIDMVDMRLSTALLYRFCFFGPPASWERKLKELGRLG